METKPYNTRRTITAEKNSQLGKVKNRRAALQWLREKGWRCGRGTLYRHVSEGKLPIQADGSVAADALELYALTHLHKKALPPDCGAVASLLKIEKQAQIELLQTRQKKLAFELALQEGQYLARDAVLLEWSVKLGLFDSVFKTTIRTHVAEWLLAIGADPSQAGALFSLFEFEIDALLDRMADLQEIRVRVKRNTEALN